MGRTWPAAARARRGRRWRTAAGEAVPSAGGGQAVVRRTAAGGAGWAASVAGAGRCAASRQRSCRGAGIGARGTVRGLAQDRRLRAPADPARSRAASMLSDACVRAATRRPRTLSDDPAPAVGKLPAAQRDAPQRDVQRPQQQREDQQPRPHVRVAARRLQVVHPDVGRQRRPPRRPSRPGSRPGAARWRPGAGTRPAVGATSPSVRPSGAVAGLGLGHAHRVGAALERRDRRLVHARRHLRQVHGRGLQVRSHQRDAGRVEVARRAVGVDALDAQVRPPAAVDERGLDAAALLARERPAHHLAGELREARPADPALGPAARRVRRPGDRPAEPVLPLGEERVVARRDEDRLRGRLGGRPVVAQQRRQPALDAAQDRRRRGQDREELSPPRSAGRRPAGSP